jgi:hypothetical protein
VKAKLVQIKNDLEVNEHGFVLTADGKPDERFWFMKTHGYQPNELYWVVDNDFDEESWIVVKSHRVNREGFVPGAIAKAHATVKGGLRTLLGKFELGQNGLDAIKVRIENLERRRANQRDQLQHRLNTRDALWAESQRNYEAAVASAQDDAKNGRISR